MKFAASFALASLAATVSAVAVGRVNPRLEVRLERESNTGVKISLTNNGERDLRLLNKGTILDASPVEKVHVYRGAKKQGFHGMRKRVSTSHGLEDNLTPLKRGQTIDVHVEAAQVHDLTAGGKFSLQARGSIPYAEFGADGLKGVAKFESLPLDLDVDSLEASRVPGALSEHQKRSMLQSDCTGDVGAATQTALTNCAELAQTAADFALHGDAGKIIEYFKAADNRTRSTINARLNAVAKECSSTDSGATKYYCNEADYEACEQGVLAYTYPDSGVVVNCDLYYSALPDLSSDCHEQDQATTTLHEFTHANGVYNPGTDDNAYGYDACVDLDTNGALNNADTYALFANALYSQC